MKCILFGCPGAGKGTQAKKICEKFQIPHISTGDMLREEISKKSELGKLTASYINKGELLPDDIIVKIVNFRIAQEDCKHGFLLDGFPRNVGQANALQESGVALDAVVELQVPDENIIERLTGRRVHLKSGRSYHIKFNPPKVEGMDDLTGEPLTQREDDKEETIKIRLNIYHKQIAELVPFYNNDEQSTKYFAVDGIGNIETIFKDIDKYLSSI